MSVGNLSCAPTLGRWLSSCNYSLGSNTNATASYDPGTPNLGTNTSVWTWPVNLSCVGHDDGGFQVCALTPSEALTSGDNGGELHHVVTFMDTNGVIVQDGIRSVVPITNDLWISFFSNTLPATIFSRSIAAVVHE